jgi:glycosyltransferase involved in cell wall biosynthesis
MSKRYEGASVRPQALIISPEAPYPPVGGGPMRTASLIEYFARRYNIDVITFRENDSDQRQFPAERVRDTLTIDLPRHSKSLPARAGRNFHRFLGARPPLLDRYSGFGETIAQWTRERVYSFVVIEHFWCAPYGQILRQNAERLVIDMHNIESTLQETSAESEAWPLSMMFRRFAGAYTDLERELLPQFDDVLVTSPDDARRVLAVTSAPRVTVYPNAIARVDQPDIPEENAIVFSGNLEYHANASAIRWFGESVWPRIRKLHPELEWRLIGRNPESVTLRVPGMNVVGPVDDAVRALAAGRIAVVPLLSGSGTRFKILEAWAAGRAVVSTSLGAEGLGARGGEHLLIADDEVSFAAAIETLLDDEPMRRRLGAHGRKLYLEKFTTESAWRTLDAAGF